MRTLDPLLLLTLPISLVAQIAPCGLSIVKASGSDVENRFVEAPPKEVRAAVLRALPAVGAKLHKEKDLEIEAKTDEHLAVIMMRSNKDKGQGGFFAGRGAFGTYRIRLSADTREGKSGTTTQIEFRKNKLKGRMGSNRNATPLMDEIACLVKTMSPADPVSSPRGLGAGGGSGLLPKDTPVKLLLREFFYTKNIRKGSNPEILFEVAENVEVDGKVLIRRGALAKGRLTAFQHAKGYGRHAQADMTIETAIAVDGQAVKLEAPTETSRGGRKNDTVVVALTSPALGWLAKGNEVLIRAGTTYEASVADNQQIGDGK